MFEFDPVIRAMGLYKYIIYTYERAAIIAAINFNKIKAQESGKEVAYYLHNIRIFANQLRGQRYEKWTTYEKEDREEECSQKE